MERSGPPRRTLEAMRSHLRRALALPGLLTLGLAGAGGTGGPPAVDAFAVYDAAARLLADGQVLEWRPPAP